MRPREEKVPTTTPPSKTHPLAIPPSHLGLQKRLQESLSHLLSEASESTSGWLEDGSNLLLLPPNLAGESLRFPAHHPFPNALPPSRHLVVGSTSEEEGVQLEAEEVVSLWSKEAGAAVLCIHKAPEERIRHREGIRSLAAQTRIQETA